MIRVRDLGANLRFFSDDLGPRETRRMENTQGRCTSALYLYVRSRTEGLPITDWLLYDGR